MTLLWEALLIMGAVLFGGGVVVFLQRKNQGKIIEFMLSLSGGFLLAIAFVHFIPEIYETGSENVKYYILLGFLVQLFLEYFSGGIEHGHVHGKNIKGAIPWALFIALSFHSLFEGMPLGAQILGEGARELGHIAGHQHHLIGIDTHGLLIGIILHKIPVAIALMTLLVATNFNKTKAWIILIVFSLMSPLGIILGHFGAKLSFFKPEIILAVVVGMFLHISTTIIFESSENHKFDFLKLLSLLAGINLALAVI